MTAIYPFARTEAQMQELRDICHMWMAGPRRFWSFDEILAVLERPGQLSFFAAADEHAAWQGFILADVGPYTTDLLYIYVKPTQRRHGAGRLLLNHLVQVLQAMPQMEALFLEVRLSNVGAQTLYKGLGMEQVGLRRNYYADGEDALVFRWRLKEDV